mmetsp:Transcript_12734/g.16737  ORF Transcript_12734/g.16737 Transcript_12734/m.16737 type:complete len:627 (-) Transcript_12734:402-2282(-)|eukprot:CAMPEP_0117743624 /NCGR_PEP_ID=MMETSP0947-20121206/6255_1 /TAXON_ID=44440 /ORGANISM="Chattonella subsalsa, Strain CCMP2191" /LENGTH=626 /DNA_ID=CAMNT_0005560379 /DNA_START=44 /DNA_END=1924 /DNA_ORIENTATION=-
MIFNVDLVGFGVVKEPPDASMPFAVYILRVQQPLQSWTCYRRYYNFQVLAEELMDAGFINLPEIMQENADDFSHEYLELCRVQLQQWLQTLLQIQGVAESFIMRNFMCTEPNLPPSHLDIYWAGEYRDSLDDMEIDMLFDRHLEEHETDESVEDFYDNNYAYGGENLPGIDKNDIRQSTILPVGSLSRGEEFGSFMFDSAGLPPPPGLHEILGDDVAADPNLGYSSYGAMNMTPTPNNTDLAAIKQRASAEAVHPPPVPLRSAQKRVGLDSFKIIKVIGKGSFGKVFLAREKKTRQLYALKVLRKDNIVKRNQVEHTKTERNVLGYVKHPFIVGLNMAFQTRDKLFFVLDYCAGGELFFHLGKVGKFPEPRARFYAAQIVLALDYVHKLDIIYRDLKPENVLLDARGHVRLTDFGLSKEGVSDNTSGAHSFCGTPEYLAPEILNRQGHGRAVDWWSLGALLYEMLTGLPPFYCRDREKLFEKIRKAELNYPKFLSENAILILKGLLTRDPAQRLGSGEDDSESIKQHPFFAEIDWVKLSNGEVPTPWQPSVCGSLDTSQFDREFTSMPIISPEAKSHYIGTHDNTFEGFTFTDKTSPMYQAMLAASPHPNRSYMEEVAFSSNERNW